MSWLVFVSLDCVRLVDIRLAATDGPYFSSNFSHLAVVSDFINMFQNLKEVFFVLILI